MTQSRETNVGRASVSRRLSTVARTFALIACSSMGSEAFAQSTLWRVVCDNRISSTGVQCGEVWAGGSSWVTESSTGTAKTGGHDRTEYGIRTHDRFSSESTFGSISTDQQSGFAIGLGTGAGYVITDFYGVFQDYISLSSRTPGVTNTLVRFIWVIDSNLVAEVGNVLPNGSARSNVQAWLKLTGLTREACSTAWVGSTSASCGNVQPGPSRILVTEDVLLGLGTHNFQSELSVNTYSTLDIRNASSGASFASATVQSRLYIQPLDSRVHLQSGSGFDYAPVPVPEPGTWALWLLGLCLLARNALQRRASAGM